MIREAERGEGEGEEWEGVGGSLRTETGRQRSHTRKMTDVSA